MEQWERNREKSKKYGADSSIDIMRRDSNDDLMYGDTERPPDPMKYCPDNKKSAREER